MTPTYLKNRILISPDSDHTMSGDIVLATAYNPIHHVSTVGIVDYVPDVLVCDFERYNELFPNRHISSVGREMQAIKNECKFNNCVHLNEPKCAVITAVEKGEIALSRYSSYVSIMSGEELDITHYE